MKRLITGILLLSLVVLSLLTESVASAQQGTTTPAAPAAGLTAPGFIRVIQVARATGTVDVALNNSVAFSQIAFGKASDFQPVTPGLYTVEARNGGTASGKVDIVLASGVSANVLVLPKPNAAGSSLVVFVTNRAPTKAKSRIEFFNAMPGATKLDVLQDGKPVLTEIRYGKPGNTPQNLAPGTYQFSFVATKTTSPALLDIKGMELNADTIYTVIAAPDSAGKASAFTLTTSSPDEAAAPATPAR